MALLPAAADAAAGALGGAASLPAACAAGALGVALLPFAVGCAADAFGLESVAVLTAACCGALALPWLSCGGLFLLLSGG